ncbi:hypothetical protein [Haloarcula salinisoli]|uniref:Uncharacterized protein n=1 Tax=Haloarcula salinisoli TaxID=2487746 RepID=A0A8J8C7K4_9EURY|nr:hypothetical protein [Halomicroarcula salinisoli]MBX0286323.1 hypothetical protein [Halomicroarcula salinisoli]MBX0302189.1 hypothetical protein [Halomicroarcula salinisoli]
MTDSPTRRRYLAAASAVLGLAAGCLERDESTAGTTTATGTATDTPSSDQSVTVTRSRTSARAPTDWERTLRVSTADGRVTETLVCGDTTRTDSATLPESELDPFRDLAGSDAVTELDSRYDCEERCPTDIPPTTLTITTPGVDRTVTVEAGAETPALLDRVMNALDDTSQHVSTDGCAPTPPTETR